MPFDPFLGEGSPTKVDCRPKVGYPYSNLSNLEDLAPVVSFFSGHQWRQDGPPHPIAAPEQSLGGTGPRRAGGQLGVSGGLARL